MNLSVDEVLTTTRSVRKRLDFEKPVPREVLMECLELALQAPTGSNAQGWQWVFVTDADKKKAIADIYLANARATSACRHPNTRRATPAANACRTCATPPLTSPSTCTRHRCC
ncbi:nitroreductase family protein [Mycobacterium xenopi 4042]|uniref:Nitroreductase family protein n=1 Tax=Mycobacterium xenopi 4042 TaxID=1299334 RepID=X7YJM4_MYCXE|nr:nitroreductase family protein [Mycobacterium xenopi 4042]EUA52827.1 nitroreductase family protein [Mycobacterium xenopi 3993]